jgi:hypothetical protein
MGVHLNQQTKILAPYYKQFATVLNSLANGYYTKQDILSMRNEYEKKAIISENFSAKYPTNDEYEGMNAKLLFEDNVKLANENKELRTNMAKMRNIIQEKLSSLDTRHKALCREVLKYYTNGK